MALIKRANSSRLLKDAVVLNMGDLAREAQGVLAAAHAEANEIIAAASQESDRLARAVRADAHAAGLAEGLAEGRERGRAEAREAAHAKFAVQLTQLNERWQTALDRWENERQAMLSAAREEVVRFAFALGEKVLQRAIERDGAPTREQLDAALALLTRPTSIEVLIHPGDRPLIEEALPELTARLGAAAHASLRDDESITRGGCIVRTAGGEIDATIPTQLARIAEALVPPRRSATPHDSPASAGVASP